MSTSRSIEGPVYLASRSPRRRKMLTDAGIAPIVRPAGFDDGDLTRGRVSEAQWVMALAYSKARWVHGALVAEGVETGTVLGADTVCVNDGEIYGQPVDGEDARRMISAMRDQAHVTMTGVCGIPMADHEQSQFAPGTASGGRWMFVDRATVVYGHVTDAQIDEYVDSEGWRGKAGAYNLSERIEAGWPIRCEGDHATVMGLPMRRLMPWLRGHTP